MELCNYKQQTIVILVAKVTNLCFRFDIEQKPKTGEFELWLFFILQRKGIYCPVWIKHIEEKNMSEIEQFLKMQWKYMQNQWKEIAEN